MMRKLLLAFLFIISFASDSFGALPLSPPVFELNGKKIVPVDFKDVELDLTFDVEKETVAAKAKVVFTAEHSGFPFFDLVPDPDNLIINGIEVHPTSLVNISSPDNESSFRMLDYSIKRRTSNTLLLTYELNTDKLTNFEFSSTGVDALFSLNDLKRRHFWENYGPANFEFDQFSMTLRIKVLNEKKRHRLFTNGQVIQESNNTWIISFPQYYTSSSFYLHLSDKEYHISSGLFNGLNNKIPVQVYSDLFPETTSKTLNDAMKIMAENENRYGEYPHEQMTIYVSYQVPAIMEYSGALTTMPNLPISILRHEITHSWFARSVFPASGRDGWIDEAVVSWQDNNFPRKAPDLNRPLTNLADFSPYIRATIGDGYEDGMTLLSEIDYLLSEQGGLLPLLAHLFITKKNQVINTEYFKKYLEDNAKINLDYMFSRFVYGRIGSP